MSIDYELVLSTINAADDPPAALKTFVAQEIEAGIVAVLELVNVLHLSDEDGNPL